MRLQAASLALCLAARAASASAAPPAPPPLADAFSVRFAETFSGYPAAPSSGAWFYDYPARLWRAEHDAPQVNNFCSCANNATTDACALLFVPAAPAPYAGGGLFVDFPARPDDCCWLCGAAEGCTPLTPTWLSGAKYTSAGVDAAGCDISCVPGDQAAADCLSYPRGGSRVPCLYTETFSFGPGQTVVHNLTFDRASYAEGAPPAALFRVRDACAKPCPRLFPATCG